MPHSSSLSTNALAQASSSYLRSAMHQPIQWHEWGDEAFAKAQRENKPILLDIGAVWCHWCHVMDREYWLDRKSTRLNSSHEWISYAVFCLKKKKKNPASPTPPPTTTRSGD